MTGRARRSRGRSRREGGHLSRAACVALLLASAAPAARAAGVEVVPRADGSVREANLDTTYGRLDGDLALGVGLGATFGPTSPRGEVELRLRYLETAGIFAAYEDGFSESASDPRRVVAAGLELRPMFLGRWLTGTELALPRVDLLLDSLGFEVGFFFEQPALAGFSERPGLQAGIGLELPILARAEGPWIGVHGGARWSDAELWGAAGNDAGDRSLYLTVTIAYHHTFSAHLVDAGDRAPW